MHSKSDLDLLILIRDEKGYQLADCFILEDVDIGYDLYCTTWEMLEQDARCGHAHLSKLLDSRTVYVNHPAAVLRLEQLREKAKAVLESDQCREKAKAACDNAKAVFADCFLTESLSQVRCSAGNVIYYLLDAVMLNHAQYFRKGVKRTFSEVSALELPFDMEALVMAVIRGETVEEIRRALSVLLRTVRDYLESTPAKETPAPNNLTGTYEEMFSNWRNKMWEAEENQDLFSSYMNLLSLHVMLQEIAEGVAIREPDAMAGFDPRNLQKNAEFFDDVLRQFREEYSKAGMSPKVYSDVDEFVKQY